MSKVLAQIHPIKTESIVGTVSASLLGIIQSWHVGDVVVSLLMAIATGLCGYFGTQLAKYIHSKFKKNEDSEIPKD